MLEIICRTGDPVLDQMGEILVKNAAETVLSALGEGQRVTAERIVMTFRAEEARAEDLLILLYRGEREPVCIHPMSRTIRCPYAVSELEKAVRGLVSAAVTEAKAAEAAEAAEPVEVDGTSAEPVFFGRRVSFGEHSVLLTKKEAALFAILYENRGSPVSREQLTEAVWGGEVKTNLCDVYICRLRTALEPIFGKGFLVNIRNEGYRMV